ncbi:MAG: CAP domain-containing protein [Ruminococcus flavefaciens]|nr:CAP domain-containing protein [Ruminococcus flavefaciens]
MKKIISAVIACFLVSGTAFSANATDFRSSLPETATVSYDSSKLAEYAEQVAVLVNEERTAYGLQPVRISPILSEDANIRAVELKENFSHTRPNGADCFTAMSELGIKYRAAAENIAYGQKNPESVMNAWMNSSGHRANILNENMEYIGVSVFYQDGAYYWSQFFAVSDNLSDDAYLPGKNGDTAVTSPSTTTAKPITTVQISSTTAQATTAQVTTAVKPITTTSTQTIATEQITATTKCSETAPVYDYNQALDFSDIVRKILFYTKQML